MLVKNYIHNGAWDDEAPGILELQGGNFLYSMALHSSVRATVSYSGSFFSLAKIPFINFI